jgi:hypothetical protein
LAGCVRKGAMMYFITILFVFSAFSSIFAEQNTIIQAHNAYATKDFAHALNLYRSIVPKGSLTWYNMGNCAYYLQNYHDALLYWLCAYKCASSDGRIIIKKNIESASRALEMCVDLSLFEETGLRSIPIFVWQIVFIVLLVFFLVTLIRWNLIQKPILFCTFLILLIICGLLVIVVYQEKNIHYALVQDDVSVYAGPHDQYTIRGFLKPYQLVQVTNKKNDWFKIKSGTIAGWVTNKKLIEI